MKEKIWKVKGENGTYVIYLKQGSFLIEKKGITNLFLKEIFEGDKLVWIDKSSLALLKNQKTVLQISVSSIEPI
jgi:hypothetical protein